MSNNHILFNREIILYTCNKEVDKANKYFLIEINESYFGGETHFHSLFLWSGPANNQTCPVIVAEEGKDKNVTIDDPAAWMYDKCLDVDECALGIYECDKNAYCENTDVSYECKCKRGYIQEGKSCQKT